MLALIVARLIAAADAAHAPPADVAKAFGGTAWDYAPYRIAAFVKFDSDFEWSADRRKAVLAAIKTRAASVIGGLWQLEVAEAPADLHWPSAAEIDRVAQGSLASIAPNVDKVFLLGVGAWSQESHRLYGREYDVRTEDWGPPRSAIQRAGTDVSDALVVAMGAMFRYLARIDEMTEQGRVVMRLRGGALPVASPTYLAAPEQLPFRPVIRHFDAAGRTAKDGLFPIDWTWLLVESTEGAIAKSQIVSGVQDALELKFDGRTEYLALAEPLLPAASTELVIRARGTDRPLQDVEVLLQGADNKPPQLVGRTNADGAITVNSRKEFVMVFLRSGDDLLARFPLVPGYRPSVVARVEDNGRRLETAALVDRLTDDLVDLVAQQTVLKARFQRQVVHGQLDAAEKTLAAMTSLKTSDAFLKSIDDKRAALGTVTSDASAADWLDKRLAEIKPLATQKLLDAQGIQRLQGVLTDVRGH